MDLYRKLLEQVAVAKAASVDDDGYFFVEPSEEVAAAFQGKKYKVFIHKLLERSGLAVLDSPDGGRRRFRLDPPWVHLHLYESAQRGAGS